MRNSVTRECEESNENVANQRGYAENLGGIAENAENQCGDAGNQGGNVGIAVEMTMKIYVIFKLILLVPLFRPSVFRVVFFSIFQFVGDTKLFGVTILKQTYKRKKQFSRSDKFLF